MFNEDTVDKALEQLMRAGEKGADGDRLGKTIIFAKNHAHGPSIADRFDKNYPYNLSWRWLRLSAERSVLRCLKQGCLREWKRSDHHRKHKRTAY
jgi:hypothetical protein